MGCSATPKVEESNPTDSSSDASTADVEAPVEGAAGAPVQTPPQPDVALDVLYEEENVEALNDWSFTFSEWEAIGPFKIFMPISEVVDVLGDPEEVSDQSEWYGSQVDFYEYPSKGYAFHVSRDGDEYEGKVLAISAREPAAEATRLGAKVGARAEEIEATYGPYVNRRVSGEGNLSIGFMYTWVQFLMVDGFVVEMHIGTGDPFDSFGDGED